MVMQNYQVHENSAPQNIRISQYEENTIIVILEMCFTYCLARSDRFSSTSMFSQITCSSQVRPCMVLRSRNISMSQPVRPNPLTDEPN